MKIGRMYNGTPPVQPCRAARSGSMVAMGQRMKHTRTRILVTCMAAIVALGCCLSLAQASVLKQHAKKKTGAKYRIGFHFWKPGTIYDEAMEGIQDGLTLAGISYEAVIMQADKDKEKAIQNLRTLDAMGLDLIYSLSSAGTQIAKDLGMKTPVIATVINHPASLGLGKEGGAEKTRITGTSYYVEAEKQLQLYRQLFPGITKVGMIYDKNNPAGTLAEEPFMRQACDTVGVSFLSFGVEKKDELTGAAQALLSKGVETIVIPTNTLVYENLQFILDVTREHKIPLLSMNKQGVESGALAGLFADTYKLGRYTADLAKQILEKKVDLQHLPFQFIPEPDIILNLQTATALNYEFPAEVLGHAAIILQ